MDLVRNEMEAVTQVSFIVDLTGGLAFKVDARLTNCIAHIADFLGKMGLYAPSTQAVLETLAI